MNWILLAGCAALCLILVPSAGAEEVKVPLPSVLQDNKKDAPTAPTPGAATPSAGSAPKGELPKGAPQELLDQGIKFYKAKSYHQADLYLSGALAGAKGDSKLEGTAREYLGLTYIQQENFKDAAAQLEAARALNLPAQQTKEIDAALTYISTYGGIKTSKTSTKSTANAGGAAPRNWFVSATLAGDYVTGLADPKRFDFNTLNVKRNEDFRAWGFVDGGYRWKLSEKDKLTTEYSFYQSSYKDFDPYNIQMHQPRLTWEHDFNKRLFTRTSYEFSYLLLSGSLDPYIWTNKGREEVWWGETSKGKFWFAGDYQVQHDNYRDSNADQDAVTHTFGFTQYVLLPSWKKYLSFSYHHIESTAHRDLWTNRSDKLSLSGTYNFTKRDSIYAEAGYENTPYYGKDPLQIDRKRHDEEENFLVRYTHNFTKHIEVFGQFRIQEHDSNVRRDDFESQTFTVGATVRW